MNRTLTLLILLLCITADASADTYAKIRPLFWSYLYPDGGWTLYCNERFPGKDAFGRLRGLNIEHVYPASWMADHLKCGTRNQCRHRNDFNAMESDPHNLWPTLAQYNQTRSNIRYGEIPGEQWLYSGCDFEISTDRVEPSPIARGPIARSMLYMHDTYGLPINTNLMMRWHERHPVTVEERRRNRVINRIWRKNNHWIEEAQ